MLVYYLFNIDHVEALSIQNVISYFLFIYLLFIYFFHLEVFRYCLLITFTIFSHLFEFEIFTQCTEVRPISNEFIRLLTITESKASF